MGETAHRRSGDDAPHWWGEAPERSLDFRNAVGLSGPMVNSAEPLVPECATGNDRLASPDGFKND